MQKCACLQVDFPRDEGPAQALLMPLSTGGSLKKYVATHALSPASVVRLATHMARAIEHLHSYEVIHKDIALRNFVLTADVVPVLIDFGLSAYGVVSEILNHLQRPASTIQIACMAFPLLTFCAFDEWINEFIPINVSYP